MNKDHDPHTCNNFRYDIAPNVQNFTLPGYLQVMKAASQVSAVINSKRRSRGLQPRPVRACVIGFPNVGKSALINRLVKRRACESAPKPGVTRNLKWVRVGGELDMLDAPGQNPVLRRGIHNPPCPGLLMGLLMEMLL